MKLVCEKCGYVDCVCDPDDDEDDDEDDEEDDEEEDEEEDEEPGGWTQDGEGDGRVP